MHNFSPLLPLDPQLFYQLYIIHGYLCGRLLPLVYCGISGKSEDIYGETFDVILQHLSPHPKVITIDFEKVVENVKQQLTFVFSFQKGSVETNTS